MKTFVIGIVLMAIGIFVTLQIASGEWTIELPDWNRHQPATILKGPNFNDPSDPYTGTIDSQPAFNGNRFIVDCGPRCVPLELNAEGDLVDMAIADKSNPLCSQQILSPEQVIRAFALNEIRAESAAEGRCWRVRGRIIDIETNLIQGARFSLLGPRGSSILCEVSEVRKGRFIEYNPGDEIIVKGVGPRRFLGTVVFAVTSGGRLST
jgi:hypothetical protein